MTIKSRPTNIWNMFPQNERQVAKCHFHVITRFMLLRLWALQWYMIQGCCLIWGAEPIISLRTSFYFVFYWFLQFFNKPQISFKSHGDFLLILWEQVSFIKTMTLNMNSSQAQKNLRQNQNHHRIHINW